jgi:hypothetical protein
LTEAFTAYDPENEDRAWSLYESVRGSRFPRVRAECFLCYGALSTAGDENWRERMRQLGTQETMLIAYGDPAIERIHTRRDEIIALVKANNAKKRKRSDSPGGRGIDGTKK